MKTNEQEFTRLIMEHKGTINMVCRMFSTDRDEVKDLFQDIVLKLWKGYQTFKGDADIRTWIYRVSLNSCINHSTGRKRRGEKVRLNADIDISAGTEDKAMQTRQLYERIHRLGLVDRGLVLLWLEGLSYEEIGEIVGISTKNVSIRLFRIKEQLKQMSNK